MDIYDLEKLVKKAWENGLPIEGSADEAERKHLASLVSSPSIKTIAEIGFNAGISSHTFLASNPSAIVYSFDLGEYSYVQPAKQLIDNNYPDRHHLILGDSAKTVPEFYVSEDGITFDVIFIDGSHECDAVKTDILNMRSFATPETIVVIDDLTPWKPWGKGPTQAWSELVADGVVEQHGLYKDGQSVQTIEPPGERSWAIGSYLL